MNRSTSKTMMVTHSHSIRKKHSDNIREKQKGIQSLWTLEFFISLNGDASGVKSIRV